MGLGTPDCPIFAGMYEYSALAAGATLLGAERILAGEAGVAFNPAGGLHHAAPARASGFCYINDAALACLLLSEARDRVLFVDVDVHHGDGVQNAFYDRADVMTISFHESGRTLFPGTGAATDIGRGAGRGFSVNVPLPVGTYDQVYLGAFRDLAMPLARAYDPAVIVLELGADGLAGDPLAHLQLTNNVYAEVVRLLRSLQRPILATGGGGYDVGNTVRAWALAWTALCGVEDGPEPQAGTGGVMPEGTDGLVKLRDRALQPDPERCAAIDAAVAATVREVAGLVFPVHGLDPAAAD